ncbi:hypothetical protein REPUB_Repub10bG0084200 [Reevesia pubescens]
MAHMSTVLLLFLLVSIHVNVIAQENEPNTIQPGSSLYPSKYPTSWASASGHFEFGFYPQGNGFAVGIWLVGRPENTIVWTAKRDDPPLSSNTTFEFTREGDLLLHTENGKEKLIDRSWEGSVDSASMLDTGNFVLYQNRSVVWESFDFPTDTILGGQNLSTEKALVSSLSRSNHSSGQYFLSMQSDGNLVAYVNNSAEADSSDAYWASDTSGLSFYVLNLNKIGVLVMNSSYFGQRVLANSFRTGNKTMIIYRVTLDPDGILRMYSHQLESNTISSGSGIKEWQNLNDKCDVNGQCGLNSYCSGRGNDVGCYCYPGFTFIDDNRKFLGCSQNFTLDGCESRKDLVMHYNVTTLENMTWACDPYSVMHLKKEDCKKDCKEDCFCGGVLYSSGNCSKYSLPLKYGRRRENISTTAFIKFIMGSTTISTPSQSGPTPILIKEGNQSLISTMGLSLGSVAGLCFVIAICSFLIYRHRILSYRKLLESKNLGLTEQFTLRSFSFNELDKATDGFKDELGRGSFGAVYKGTLPGDSKTIVVKRLEKVDEGERDQFRTEMTVIGRTNHRNLVRLLGFCVEGSRKLLVYEYLSNGSLVDFLFNINKRPIWKERVRIALDVARGILYLHEECEVCIIHCNIKPQNILLDDSMTAKISDFGLAKLYRAPDQIISITGIKGAAGYSAPEWQRNALLSVKVDIYSFGVILLEIICCRNRIEVQVPSADEILLSTWVYNCFVAGELNKLVEGEEMDMKMVKRFVKVGLWCIQDDPNLRPLMKNVNYLL